MSAADWRKAMNAGAGRQAWQRATSAAQPAATDPRASWRSRTLGGNAGVSAGRTAARSGTGWATGAGPVTATGEPSRLRSIVQAVSARHVIVLLALLVFPFVATPFFTYQIMSQALILGMVALSLTFLGGYGGMISLAQMTVAGITSLRRA